MTNLLSLPDEILLQILSYNVPLTLRSRADFISHIRSGAATKRLLRLTRTSFFDTFTHNFFIICILNICHPRHLSHQVHIDGVLTGRTSFVRQVRKVELKLGIYYPQSVEHALGEVKGVLERYTRLRKLRVVVSGDVEVDGLVRGVEGVFEEERVKLGGRTVDMVVEKELQKEQQHVASVL